MACGSITALEQINAKGVFEKHRINEEVTVQSTQTHTPIPNTLQSITEPMLKMFVIQAYASRRHRRILTR